MPRLQFSAVSITNIGWRGLLHEDAAFRNSRIDYLPRGAITKVESLTKNGKVVAYEANVKTGTKHSEVQVGADGKKLAHPE